MQRLQQRDGLETHRLSRAVVVEMVVLGGGHAMGVAVLERWEGQGGSRTR